MSRLDPATASASAFGVGLVVIALVGCTQLEDLAGQRHREAFPTYEVAESAWVGVDIPDWIPGDATDLRNVATSDETMSVIRVITDSPLAGTCEIVERAGIPALNADWSTAEWPNEIARCGDYEVMAMDDGWLGWYNATEPGATPR